QSMSTEAAIGTGSRTIADLIGLAAAKYADRPMVRRKQDGEWVETTFAQAGEIVSELGRGLIDLGLDPGDRVCILANTRPEWTYADFAITSAGLVVVPIYQTNSPKECEWVVGNSEARAVVCEDAEQLAKILEVRENLPALEHLIVMDPAPSSAPAELASEREAFAAISFEELRARGRGRDPQELADRAAAVTPDDPFTFIYTSGTTGPPKGCVLSHGNYRAMLDMCNAIG